MHATLCLSKQRANGTGLGAPADAGSCLPASHVARGGGGGGGGLTNIGIASARALKMKIEPLHSNYSCIRSRYTVRDMVVLNKT